MQLAERQRQNLREVQAGKMYNVNQACRERHRSLQTNPTGQTDSPPSPPPPSIPRISALPRKEHLSVRYEFENVSVLLVWPQDVIDS